MAIFIVYVKLISRMEDIRRTFMYHGAEHKCINCVEHGHAADGGNMCARAPRSTSAAVPAFMLIVMVISILIFMVIRVDTIWLRILSRIILVPVIAGISYEVIAVLAGRSEIRSCECC